MCQYVLLGNWSKFLFIFESCTKGGKTNIGTTEAEETNKILLYILSPEGRAAVIM